MDFAGSTEVAAAMGRELLRTGDLGLLPEAQLGALKDAVKRGERIFFGDKWGLSQARADRLKGILEPILGEPVNVYAGTGPLVLEFATRYRSLALEVNAFPADGYRVSLIAVVDHKKVPPLEALLPTFMRLLRMGRTDTSPPTGWEPSLN